MSVSTEALAWRSGEGPGFLYTAKDLQARDKVKELFSACKEAEGYITAEGWSFLFSIWSLESMLSLDNDIGWFHSGKETESSAHLIYQSLMAGFDPISREKGDYEADSGLFLSLKGNKYKIDWDEIIRKKG